MFVKTLLNSVIVKGPFIPFDSSSESFFEFGRVLFRFFRLSSSLSLHEKRSA